jgi:hypothetical protein
VRSRSLPKGLGFYSMGSGAGSHGGSYVARADGLEVRLEITMTDGLTLRPFTHARATTPATDFAPRSYPHTPLSTTPHQSCHLFLLVVCSPPRDISIQPIYSRLDQRRRHRPAGIIIVTIAQSDCDIRSSRQQSHTSNTSSLQHRRPATRRITRYRRTQKRRTAIHTLHITSYTKITLISLLRGRTPTHPLLTRQSMIAST